MTRHPCRGCGVDHDTIDTFGSHTYPDRMATSSDAGQHYCRDCYYAGIPLADNMERQLEVLTSFTRTDWVTEHTGGCCFWLRTHLGTGHLILTEWPDVLTGFSRRLDPNWRGWFLSVVTDVEYEYGGGDPLDSWPKNTAPDEPGLSDEDLFRAITEAIAVLAEHDASPTEVP